MRVDRTYTLHSGLAKGLKKRGGLGIRQSLGLGEPTSAEDEFLQGLTWRGRTIVDVGGYEGIHTIFFASRVGEEGRVVTFEPNPDSYRHVLDNVRINGFSNVEVRNVGLADAPGELEFVYPSDRGRGTAFADGREYFREESGAQISMLPVTSIDAEVEAGRCPPPDFVKIDVEGLEEDVLRGMADTVERCRPALFIEIHGWSMQAKEENARRVVELLAGYGYAIRHVESQAQIATANAAAAREGHLYCTSPGDDGERRGAQGA
jgi:FkbM family methyltransferase